MTEVDAPLNPAMSSAGGFGTLLAAMVMVMKFRSLLDVSVGVSVGLRPRPRHDPERAPLLHPRRALVAQQGAPDFSGIIARLGADYLEALRMLVAAEPILQEIGHPIGDRLTIRIGLRHDDGMHALPQLRIGQSHDHAGPYARAFGDGCLALGRIDVGAPAQDHVGEAVAEIEVALRIQPADVAERFPAVGAALRLGAEVVIGGVLAVIVEEVDLAGLARRNVVAVLADDAQARHLADLADRALVRQPFRAGDDAGALPLGAAIELPDSLGPEPGDPVLLQPGWHRSGHVEDG